MESPYFSNHWSHPSHRRYFHAPSSQVPVHRARSSQVQKVVEIPVHYVSSNRPNRSDSAVKIQKLFRGYLVRKSVKKIDEIRRDVIEIEKRILRKEYAEAIKNDANEWLRLNESLMNLLFRLDSVLGVDFSVREFRKRVIKGVIRLQEIVDEIALSGKNGADVLDGEVKEDLKPVETTGTEEADEGLPEQSNADVENESDVADGELKEVVTEEAELPEQDNADEAIDEDDDDVAGREQRDDEVAVSISEGFEESASQTDSNPLIEVKEEEKEEWEEEKREEMEVEKSDDAAAENKRSRELLERMVEDNEKMMGLMTELFERNEMQTRLLSALSQRVGQLERAFMCERLRKKKKKTGGNGGSVDCVDSNKDHCNKKCGGKKE